MQQKKFKKIGILLFLFQNFCIVAGSTILDCMLSLNDFILHTFASTLHILRSDNSN